MTLANVCIVASFRLDLLKKLVDSLSISTVRPDHVYLVYRGENWVGAVQAVSKSPVPVQLVRVEDESLAAAWNWFVEHVPEDRIIANEDIEFEPDAIRELVERPEPFVGLKDAHGLSHLFSCFRIRDSVVNEVGLFDTTISPGYVYYEDLDYARRMQLRGIQFAYTTQVKHDRSATLKVKSPEEMKEHHHRFLLAQKNYVSKWGGLPGKETKGELK